MKATILCYHKVGPRAQEGKRLNIEPEVLRSHVKFFHRRNFSFWLGKDLWKGLQPRSVCFTFDDAYRSTLDHAPEILESYGVRGSFYAVAGKLGFSSDWDAPETSALAGLDSLLKAVHSGHEVGNHSWNHRRLTELSMAEQFEELQRCHEFLQGEGILCESVCYPYGAYNPETLQTMAAFGYRVGLSLKKGNVPVDAPPLELPRIAVGYSDTLPKLLYKIHLRPALRRLGI